MLRDTISVVHIILQIIKTDCRQMASDWFIHWHYPKNNIMLNVLMEVCLLIIRIGTILEIVRYCSYSLNIKIKKNKHVKLNV